MKKFLFLVTLMITIVQNTTIMSLADSSTITPRYDNIINESSGLYIDDNGVAAITVSYTGNESILSHATIRITLQKKFLLLFWKDVSINGNDYLIIETNQSIYRNVIYTNVTSGTHRVQIEYVITNVNGGVETINREYEYKY